MIQTILKSVFDAGWGAQPQYFGLGGEGLVVASLTYGQDYAKFPVPAAGTFQHLKIHAEPTHQSLTITLQKNGVNTALVVTLGPSDTYGLNAADAIAFTAGDDLSFEVLADPPGEAGTGYPFAISVEFDSTAQFYGVTPSPGGISQNTYLTAGALGNGVFQSFAIPTSLSNTYSICAAAGTLTGLRMTAYAGAPGAGVWTGYLVKNQVVQDGTGGTVDTATVITGGATTAASTFALAIAPGDHLDIAVERTGSDGSFAGANIGAAVVFQPDDGTSFMLCGGNNDALDVTGTNYAWNRSEQSNTVEVEVAAAAGPSGFLARGLYVEILNDPGVGKTWNFVLRKNSVDTPLAITLTGTQRMDVILVDDMFIEDDLVNMAMVPTGSPNYGQFHWGLRFGPVPAPTIIAVSAMDCVRPGAQNLTITGSGFVDAPAVTVTDPNGVAVTPVTVTFVSATELSVAFLAEEFGTYCFTVVNPDEQSSATVCMLPACVEPQRQAFAIRRLRRSPLLTDELRWTFHQRFQLDLETGIGLIDGDDPQLMLRWSDDGGHTWSQEHWTGAGRIGQFTRRALWNRLGRSRQRIYELVIAAPVKVVLIDAHLDLVRGTS